MSIGRRIAKGGFWLQASRLIQLVSNVVITAVLARLLTPAIFGLAGIVTLVVSAVGMATRFGITAGIVQQRDIGQDQLSSAYWINTGFGLFSASFLAIASPWIAHFYEEPALVPLILLLSTNFLIVPTFQINRRLLEKELRFPTIAIVEVVSSLGSGVVGITMALMDFGVYSLIWQILALNILYAICFNFVKRWRPSFSFAFERVRDLTVFSLKIKGARFMAYAERNIDYVLLSKLFSPELYGMYTVGYRFVSFPVRRFGFLFSETLFPAFSRIQGEPHRIRTGVLRSVYLLVVVLLPLVILLSEFGREVVQFILGDQWMQLADILYLFAAIGAFMTLERVPAAVYPAINRPGILISFGLLRTVGTGIAVAVGQFWGLLGVAVALVVARMLLFLVDFGFLSRLISIPLTDYLRRCDGPVLSAMAMLGALWWLRNNLIETEGLLSVLATAITGAVIYVGILAVLDREEMRYYLNLLTK